jgi:histidine ammonia-lyase
LRAGAEVEVSLHAEALERIRRSRAVVEEAVRSGRVVYGVTTGFGRLSDVVVERGRLEELQENLIRSHACGVGTPLPRTETRAITLLRANVLARGFSGVRPEVVHRLLDLLNHGIHPVIPEQGSVGASGDLAPLSHLALVLLGEGEAEYGGEVMPGGEALRRAGIEPLRLQAKEGLALNNGTQVMTGIGALVLLGAERAAATADVAGAMSLEGLRGRRTPSIPPSSARVRTPARRRAPSGCARCSRRARSASRTGTATRACRTPTRFAACRRCTAPRATPSPTRGRCWRRKPTAPPTIRSSSPTRERGGWS